MSETQKYTVEYDKVDRRAYVLREDKAFVGAMWPTDAEDVANELNTLAAENARLREALKRMVGPTGRFFDEQWNCGCNGGWACDGECGGNPRDKAIALLADLGELGTK